MKAQMRRFFTIGLISGSLAVSALGGAVAVGAAGDQGSAQRDDHIIFAGAPVAPSADGTTVAIAPQSLSGPAVAQVFNDDRRN